MQGLGSVASRRLWDGGAAPHQGPHAFGSFGSSVLLGKAGIGKLSGDVIVGPYSSDETYSPELNPMEPVWKTARKMTTQNQFYETTEKRDAALRTTFTKFQRRPVLIAAHVARFQ